MVSSLGGDASKQRNNHGKNRGAGVCLECLKNSKVRSVATAELEVEGTNVRAERTWRKVWAYFE